MEQPGCARMRTVQDVLDRLKHDVHLVAHANDFSLTYVDRILGAQRIDVPTFCTHKDFVDIPIHRVRSVLFFDEVVWDREARIDQIYRSGPNQRNTIGIENILARRDELKRAQDERLAAERATLLAAQAAHDAYVAAVQASIEQQRIDLLMAQRVDASSESSSNTARSADLGSVPTLDTLPPIPAPRDRLSVTYEATPSVLLTRTSAATNAAQFSDGTVVAAAATAAEVVPTTTVATQCAHMRESRSTKTSDQHKKRQLTQRQPTSNPQRPLKTSNNNRKAVPRTRSSSPTHFLALRISDAMLNRTLGALHDDIKARCPLLTRALVPPSSYHVTLGLLRLADEQEQQEQQEEVARAVMHECSRTVRRMFPPRGNDGLACEHSIRFAGLEHFSDRVLFAKVDGSSPTTTATMQRLYDVHDVIMSACVERGLEVIASKGARPARDDEDGISIRSHPPFVPHLTIAKLSRMQRRWSACANESQNRRASSPSNDVDYGEVTIDVDADAVGGAVTSSLKRNGIPRWSYSAFDSTDFGRQRVDRIDLCAMNGAKDARGYYRVVHSIEIAPVQQREQQI